MLSAKRYSILTFSCLLVGLSACASAPEGDESATATEGALTQRAPGQCRVDCNAFLNVAGQPFCNEPWPTEYVDADGVSTRSGWRENSRIPEGRCEDYNWFFGTTSRGRDRTKLITQNVETADDCERIRQYTPSLQGGAFGGTACYTLTFQCGTMACKLDAAGNPLTRTTDQAQACAAVGSTHEMEGGRTIRCVQGGVWQ